MNIDDYFRKLLNTLATEYKTPFYSVVILSTIGIGYYWLTLPDRIKSTEQYEVANTFIKRNETVLNYFGDNNFQVIPALIETKNSQSTLHLIIQNEEKKTNIRVTLQKQSHKWHVSNGLIKTKESKLDIRPGLVSGEWSEL